MIRDDDNYKIKLKTAPNELNFMKDDDDDDDELTTDQLQILINQLLFQEEPDNFSKRLESLQFFSNYLITFKVPASIMVQLQQIIFDLIQGENSPEINEAILSIITLIYDTFSDSEDGPVDYQALIGFIWEMLPSEEAFEALALNAAIHNKAAENIMQEKETIFSWLEDPEIIHNALILINGLMHHKDIQLDLLPNINLFLELSQSLDTDNLKILYSILGHFAETRKGLDTIENYEMIGTLFDKAFENPDIFYEALRFVETANTGAKNPVLFMEKANALDFFEKSISADSDPKIFKEGLNLCLSVSEVYDGVHLLLDNGTVDKLFSFLNSSHKISNLVLQTICYIVSKSPPELVPQFMEKDLIELISLNLPVSNERCQIKILQCLITITNSLQNEGDTESIEELATDDLRDSLIELMNNTSRDNETLESLARYVYSIIFPQE